MNVQELATAAQERAAGQGPPARQRLRSAWSASSRTCSGAGAAARSTSARARLGALARAFGVGQRATTASPPHSRDERPGARAHRDRSGQRLPADVPPRRAAREMIGHVTSPKAPAHGSRGRRVTKCRRVPGRRNPNSGYHYTTMEWLTPARRRPGGHPAMGPPGRARVRPVRRRWSRCCCWRRARRSWWLCCAERRASACSARRRWRRRSGVPRSARIDPIGAGASGAARPSS